MLASICSYRFACRSLRLSWKSLRAVRMFQAMLRIPPPMASTIARRNAAGTKVTQTVKTNRRLDPAIPAQAIKQPKSLLRSIVKPMTMPATSVKKNPINEPGVKSSPWVSIACPVAASRALSASVLAAAYRSLSVSIGRALLLAVYTAAPMKDRIAARAASRACSPVCPVESQVHGDRQNRVDDVPESEVAEREEPVVLKAREPHRCAQLARFYVPLSRQEGEDDIQQRHQNGDQGRHSPEPVEILPVGARAFGVSFKKRAADFVDPHVRTSFASIRSFVHTTAGCRTGRIPPSDASRIARW